MVETKLIEYLSDLVAINSVNPNLSDQGQGEKEIAQYIHSHFQSLGFNTSLFEVARDRCNTTSFLSGNKLSLIHI